MLVVRKFKSFVLLFASQLSRQLSILWFNPSNVPFDRWFYGVVQGFPFVQTAPREIQTVQFQGCLSFPSKLKQNQKQLILAVWTFSLHGGSSNMPFCHGRYPLTFFSLHQPKRAKEKSKWITGNKVCTAAHFISYKFWKWFGFLLQ